MRRYDSTHAVPDSGECAHDSIGCFVRSDSKVSRSSAGRWKINEAPYSQAYQLRRLNTDCTGGRPAICVRQQNGKPAPCHSLGTDFLLDDTSERRSVNGRHLRTKRNHGNKGDRPSGGSSILDIRRCVIALAGVFPLGRCGVLVPQYQSRLQRTRA